MRFNDLLHPVAFPWKAHGTPSAPGFVTATKMPESRALSKFSDHFSRYIPLSERHPGPLKVNWDNAPAHRGEAVREYLGTPGLGLRLVNLPGYSPDFNADEAIWGWAKRRRPLAICAWAAGRWCRRGPAIPWPDFQPDSPPQANAHPTLALV